MRIAKAVNNLIEAFERLPGIGPKTAARLTYYLLNVPQAEIEKFAETLRTLKTKTVVCSQCFNVAETDPCDICDDRNRDKGVICVVEHPLDVLAMDRGGGFRGVYHVLGGVIDPLHNIGPDEIRIDQLVRRVSSNNAPLHPPLNLRGGNSEGDIPVVREIILALNPNMEGEATCLYLKRMLPKEVKVTRLAHGLPVGADIEYADDMTLSRAMEGRREY
jgi:recombination protein RecR